MNHSVGEVGEVGEVGGFAGVTVPPRTTTTRSGRWCRASARTPGTGKCSDADLDRSPRILFHRFYRFYRELGFPREEIAVFLDDPRAIPGSTSGGGTRC